jgi:hypothetical protein
MQDHVGLLTGLVATLGEEDARHFLREVSKANLQGSLLKGALMSALRMFGVKPLALLRMFPRAYGTITRDCGEVSLGPTQAHDGTQACFDALPPVLRVRPFAVSLAAVFEAAFEVARRPGDVAIDDTALTEGRVRYVLRAWDRSGFDEQ